MEPQNFELIGSGNSYLILRYNSKNQSFYDSREYFVKITKTRETSLTTRYKLLFLDKIGKIFSKLPYFYELIRHLSSIDSHEAIRIRSFFGANKINFLPQFRWKEHFFYEENALFPISTSKNNFNLIFELKIKCALIDFVGFPNLFKLRKENIFDPSKVLSLSIQDIKEQLSPLLKAQNPKYLKIYIDRKPISLEDGKYVNLSSTIAGSLLEFKELINRLLVLQSYGSGQQFIAHTLYMLLDIFFKNHGQLTDSWKIYFLQWLRGLKLPVCTTRPIANQVKNYNEGLLLVKIMTMHLCSSLCKTKYQSNGIKYIPLLKLRKFLSKQSLKCSKLAFGNKSIYRKNSFKKLCKKYYFIRKSIFWLQNFFLARAAMDCSIFCDPFSGKVALVDFDIKPYTKLARWADDAYTAIEKYKN